MLRHSAAATAGATTAVLDADLDLPVFVKLSPNVTDLRGSPPPRRRRDRSHARQHALRSRRRRRAAPPCSAPAGWLSGPAIKPVALRAVHDVARANPACRSSGPAA
jgi:dihydroorotate dehydrogenase